jgi:hypothetical protein
MDGRWPPAGGGSAPVDSHRRAPNLEHCSILAVMKTAIICFQRNKEMKSVARTVRGLKRLATRTAGAMGEMVMVVMYGQDG